MFRSCTILLATALVMGGCATKPADDFNDVQQSVERRAGLHAQWNQSSQDDADAGRAVSSLLAQPLTRESAVQIAVLNNPSLQATYEYIGIAQAELVQAGLLKNPIFSGEFKFIEGRSTPHVELAISQDFLSLLQIPLRKKLAEAGVRAAKLRVTSEVLSLAAETERAFYEVQRAQQAMELRQTAERAADASAEAARQLRMAGNISDLQLATELAQYEQTKLDTAAADAEVDIARSRLNVLLGSRTAPAWTIESRLPSLPAEEPDVQDLENQAVRDRTDLSAIRVEGEAAARTLGLTKWSWLSDTEIGAAAERDPDSSWEVGPAVTLPIPLFDQGQGARGRAAAELRRVQQTHAAKVVEVRAEVRSAHARMTAARARAHTYQTVLIPLRHRIVEQTHLHYNGMYVGVFELLQAKRDEIEAGREYLDALSEYWVARSELAKAVGSVLPAGASAASATQPTTSVAPPTTPSGGHHH